MVLNWPDITFNPINLWSAPKMQDNDEPFYEPEGCEECGCPPGDFGEGDWDSGHWVCPECGACC